MLRLFVLVAISLGSATVANAETRHGLALGFQSQTIGTDDDRSFAVQTPGLGYGFHWIREGLGLFTAAEILWPLRASQDGDGFAVGDVYDSAYGAELLVAATRSLELAERWSGFGGVGGHIQMLALNDAILRDFEHAALGAAVVIGARRDLGVRWLGGELGWTTRVDLSVDPIDLARGGNLAFALAAKIAVALELAYE